MFGHPKYKDRKQMGARSRKTSSSEFLRSLLSVIKKIPRFKLKSWKLLHKRN